VAQLRRRTILARTVLAAVVATTLLGPASSDAQSGPDPAKTQRRLDQVRAQRGRVALDVDALAARENQVRAAVAKLSGNVDRQQARLDEAERAADEADAEVVAATKAVASAQTRIDQLNLITDGLVVEAYVNPPSDNALEAFRADSIIDSAVKETLVDLQSDADADALDQLKQAHEDLAVQKAEKEDLAAAAEKKRADAEAALGDLQNALDQQQTFQDQLEERLNAKLAEAESLRTLDGALSDRLVREQEALAAQLAAQAAAAQAQAPPADVAPAQITAAPGGLATVTCTGGGSITVAGSISGNVQALLDAAAADGVMLCGGGYRDPEEQIQLRREHCGTSNYAIYEMPASQCSPPTAIPGTSMHEQGLAIDFTCNGGGTVTSGDECWDWLQANAVGYGLYNLPSEPWHWSTNGN
jgi:LAS superfamily LD-carboxypeptidase LdcB